MEGLSVFFGFYTVFSSIEFVCIKIWFHVDLSAKIEVAVNYVYAYAYVYEWNATFNFYAIPMYTSNWYLVGMDIAIVVDW